MKEKITKIVSTIIIILASSLICMFFYDFFLEQTIGVPLTYVQWIALFIISNLLFKPAPQPAKNDTERPKIPRDLLKNGF